MPVHSIHSSCAAALLATLLAACAANVAEPSSVARDDGAKADDFEAPGRDGERRASDPEAWSPLAGAVADETCGTVELIVDPASDAPPIESPYGPPGALADRRSPWWCEGERCEVILPRISIRFGDDVKDLCLEVESITLEQLFPTYEGETVVADAYTIVEPRVDPGFVSRDRHFSGYGGTGEHLCRALGMAGGSYYERVSSGGSVVELGESGDHAESDYSDVWIRNLTCRRYVRDRDVLVY